MRYTRLDKRYGRFFKSGDSLYSIIKTNLKYEFIKNSLSTDDNLIIFGLFAEYMHNDILIRWSLK
jgi:hypothetical protein